MFCTFTLVLYVVRVQCLIWLLFAVPWFCAVLVCWLRYGLNDFEMVPVAPVITGITFAYNFYFLYYYYFTLLMLSEVMALCKFLEPNRCLILKMESGVCSFYQFQLTANIKTTV
jgi:hypothetical protein